MLWSLLLTVIFILVSLLLGAAIGLSQGTTEVFLHEAMTLAAACLVIVDVFPFAFFASVGRGYLLPMGVVYWCSCLAMCLPAPGGETISPGWSPRYMPG